MRKHLILLTALTAILCTACGSKKTTSATAEEETTAQTVGPAFNPDSA